MLHRIPGSVKKMGAGSSSSAWSNTRLAKTGAYAVLNGDKGSTIALSGSAFYTLTFNAASGYDANFAVMVINDDTGRAKTIAPNGLTSFLLWPGQNCLVFNDNNVWKVHPSAQRWLLTANTAFNVDGSLGSSTNDGLASGAGAFATIQQAYNAVTASVDLGGNTVTILCANQTYTAGISVTQPWTGGGAVVLNVGSGTINPTAASCVTISCTLPGVLTIQNATLQTTTTGHLLLHNGLGILNIGSGITFGTASGGFTHINVSSAGAVVEANVAYTISGNANAHIACAAPCWFLSAGITVTVSANITFATAFAVAQTLAYLQNQGNTFSLGVHTVTGSRYLSQLNGVINTNGGGASYFPGSSVGTTATGGLYA